MDTSDWYSFGGDAGTAVSIAMNTDASWDPIILLYRTNSPAASGDLVASYTDVAGDADGGPGLNSLLQVSLPATGNYVVSAGAEAGFSDPLGAYTLTIAGDVRSLAPPAPDPDADTDGHTVGGGDCDDADPAIHPGATEVGGDSIDQNCNGTDAPTVTTADPAPFPEDTSKTMVLAGVDTDSDPLTFVITSLPVNGQLFDSGEGGGTAVTTPGHTLSGDSVRYTPRPNYSGGDSFGYRADDGKDQSVEDSIDLTITPADDSSTTRYTGPGRGHIGKGATITFSGVVTSSDPACVSGRQMSFALDRNPGRGRSSRSFLIGTVTSNSSGTAVLTVATSSWKKRGNYQVIVTTPESAGCAGSVSTPAPINLAKAKGHRAGR